MDPDLGSTLGWTLGCATGHGKGTRFPHRGDTSSSTSPQSLLRLLQNNKLQWNCKLVSAWQPEYSYYEVNSHVFWYLWIRTEQLCARLATICRADQTIASCSSFDDTNCAATSDKRCCASPVKLPTTIPHVQIWPDEQAVPCASTERNKSVFQHHSQPRAEWN